MSSPRVFLSYAPDSTDHEAGVRRLWEVLRAGGVDVAYDAPGAERRDWTQWIEDRFDEADVVLVVASPVYRLSAGNTNGSGVVRGVRYQASVIRQAVYRDAGAAMRKFLPVVLPDGDPADVPEFLWPSPPTVHALSAITPEGVGPLASAVTALSGTAADAASGSRHQLSLQVAVSGGEVTCRADLSGTSLGTRTVPVPYGADQLWEEALALPPEAAAAKLHGFGRRLARVLLDEPALRTVTALVDAPGASLDVVVDTEGLGLGLPYELIRLPDDRVLACLPSVRFTRRLTGVWRAPTPPTPGPLAVVAEVAAAERGLLDELGTGADGAPVTVVEIPAGSAVGEALAVHHCHVLHLCVDAPPVPGQMPGGYLARALREATRPPALVVLWPGRQGTRGTIELAASLIRQGADRVLAMHAGVGDGYRVALGRALYRNLAGPHASVADALARARAEVSSPGPNASAHPLASPVEYGVVTLLAAAGDPPVLVPGATPAAPPPSPTPDPDPDPDPDGGATLAPAPHDEPTPAPDVEPTRDLEGELRRAIAAALDQAVGAPEDPDRLHDLAIAYSRVGDLLVERGDHGAAEPFYREGLAVTRLLLRLRPDDPRWRRELGLWCLRLGQLLVNTGHMPEGEALLREAEAAVTSRPT